VRQLGHNTDKAIADGRCAEPNEGRSRRADHDIRTYSAGPPGCPVQRSVADADEGEDHGNFYGYGKNA
jgi:hypothetical protein